jgi:hypothetical protein
MTVNITAISAVTVNTKSMRLIDATSLTGGRDSSAPPLCTYTLSMTDVGRLAHDAYALFFYENREGACLYSPRIREGEFSEGGLPVFSFLGN